MIGSVCLILVLAALLLPACAPKVVEAPELEAKIKALEGELTSEKAEVSKLEKELAEAAKPAKVFDWRFAGYTPAGSTLYDVAQLKLPALIEEATGGRIKFTSYPGGTLFPVDEALEAMGEGVCELGITAGSYFSGKLPVAGADCGVPLLYADASDLLYCNYELGVSDIKEREYTKFNVQYLSREPDSEIVLMSVKPIRTLDDFVGTKVRSFGSYLDWYEDMGMGAVFLPHDEMYMALQLGTVDAYATCPGIMYDMKGHEVCEYYYMPTAGGSAGTTIMNLDAWNSLTPDLQQAMKDAAYIHCAWTLFYYKPVYNDQALTWFDNYGLERITWSDEIQAVMIEKAEAIWDDLAEKDAASAEVINIIKGYLAKKSAGELP